MRRVSISRYPLARRRRHKAIIHHGMRNIWPNQSTTACPSRQLHVATTNITSLARGYHVLSHGPLWVNSSWVYGIHSSCQSIKTNWTLYPWQAGYRLRGARTSVFRTGDLPMLQTRQYCNRSWKPVYQLIPHTRLLSPKHQSETVDRFSSTDPCPHGITKTDHGAYRMGLLQLPPRYRGRADAWSKVWFDQFCR